MRAAGDRATAHGGERNPTAGVGNSGALRLDHVAACQAQPDHQTATRQAIAQGTGQGREQNERNDKSHARQFDQQLATAQRIVDEQRTAQGA